jgi:PAS domain S-box-containing protein
MPRKDKNLFPLILDAFDYSKDGIAVVTFEEEVLYHNKAWNEIHAIDPDVDLTGSMLKEFELETTFPLIDEAKQKLLAEGAYSSQVHVTRRDGVPRDIHILATFISHTEPPLIVVVLRDVSDLVRAESELREVEQRYKTVSELTEELQKEISDRQRAEEALRKSEEIIRSQYRSIPVPTYTWQSSGDEMILVNFNEAAEAITHGKIKDFMGITARKLFADSPEYVAQLERCLTEQISFEDETEYHYKSTGETKMLHVKFSFVEPDLVLVHTEDITERRKAEQDLIRYRDHLQELVDERTEELEKRNQELQILYNLHEIAISSNDRKSVFERLLKPIGDIFNAKSIGVYDIDEENRVTMLVASMGLPPEFAAMVGKVSMEDDVINAALSSPDILVTEDDLPDKPSPREEIKERLGIKKTILFLVKVKKQVNSLIIIGSSKDIELTQEKRDFLKLFSDQLGFALERLELIDDLGRSERELQDLTTRLFDTIEEERRLMAVRLHDGMAQSLIALNLNFDSLAGRLRADDMEGKKLLEKMRKRLNDVTASTKMISKSLHPVMLEELGLVDAIKAYVNKFIRSDDLVVEIEEIGFDTKLPVQLNLTLYRICQEALLNVVKHAGAKKVTITLTKGYPDVIMIIRDDGRGFSLDTKKTRLKGFGIAGMKERVRRLAGEFQIRSRPNEGTRIRVTLPLEENNGKRRKDTSR